MKSKTTILSILCCLLCMVGVQDAYAQKAPDANGFPGAELARKTYGISYSVPEDFCFDRDHVVFLSTHENVRFGTLYFSLESEDGRCRLFVDGYPSQGSDLSPEKFIRMELTEILETEEINIDDDITVVAGREARERFNADSVFTYDVPEFVPIPTMSQYEYCTRMYIMRKGRPMLQLIWLFTTEGKQNEEQYIRQLDGRVWYDNRWKPKDPKMQRTIESRYMMGDFFREWSVIRHDEN